MKPLRIDDRAAREIERAVAYYERQGFGLGSRLRREIENAARRIAAHPERGAPYLKTAYRFRTTRVFPYVVIYQEMVEDVVILAIRHGRQRPIRRR